MARHNDKSNLIAFTRAFYSGAWKEDLATLSEHDQKRIAQEFLEFCQQRKRNKASIQVRPFTRTAKRKRGTQSATVTIIDIVNDNMPFLVDSIVNIINSLGHTIELVFHPVIQVIRDGSGRLERICTKVDEGKKESLLHIQINQVSDSQRMKLVEMLDSTMVQIRHAVRDWKSMISKLDAVIENYRRNPPPVDEDVLNESIHFLEWLKENNFTFLGIAEYKYNYKQSGELEINRLNTGLGILSDPSIFVLGHRGQSLVMTPEIQEFLSQPSALVVTKADMISLVHRRVHLDYIGVKQYSGSGDVTGEIRMVGLFTSTAYTRSVRTIPLIQQKVRKVITKSRFDPSGHSGKGLIDVLETYPRDELFQIDTKSLYKNALTILHLQERPTIRLILRRDKFDRFVSLLVYIHRERFNSNVREKVGRYLAQVFDGHLALFTPHYLPGTLIRVHYIIGLHQSRMPRVNISSIESDIDKLSQSWDMQLIEAMYRYEDDRVQQYSKAFSAIYANTYDIETAMADIDVISQLHENNSLEVRLSTRDSKLRFRVYSRGHPISLSQRLPVLEHMGFTVINERTHIIEPKDSAVIFLYEMTLASQIDIDLKQRAQLLEQLYVAVWKRKADNDGLNGLALRAGIKWRDITLLRAMTRYLLQTGMNYDLSFIAESINRYPQLAVELVKLFYARFDPDTDSTKRNKSVSKANQKIARQLIEVLSFDDDRIISRIQNLINSVLRTNFFQQDAEGNNRPALALKLDPEKIEDMPMPRPFRETFVYSPVVEGTHLRFGMVARGGIRWSDRAQDYRTEVLDLVKAQQVKNAVIVPVGAKGCFVPRQVPLDRDQIQSEAIRAYSIYIGSLLDITDNVEGTEIIAPMQTTCHDQADPYLVVAADKGTASFSDIANDLAIDRGFWLGDAFASGGSTGYDHKKMGITARGAWESVKRHFREMDRNIQKESFTVVGVGDMSGDVFGNGMLLSKTIRLIAAFDHRDIFIDPNPDIATGFAERKRLFGLERSSWQDYDKKRISSGGGVFSRSEKSITLDQPTAQLFGLNKTKVTPYELIAAILTAQVDLLWFGGIGTYVRASNESNADVGDKSNDMIRVTASQLGCLVIGEGANLGLTQRARVEFNQLGGRCYSDAIDNSAGVNSSDLEVNVKIVLSAAIQANRLDISQRNKLLASMTHNVAQLCLANTYRQGLAISLCHRHGAYDMTDEEHLMVSLERRDQLDRKIEHLPSQVDMIERRKTGEMLTRAEVGILLAYAKNVLQQDVIASDLPDDPAMEDVIPEYFPIAMEESFADLLRRHKLKREIIATLLANALVNYGGLTLISKVKQQTGAPPEQVVKAYVIANRVYDFTDIFTHIDQLDNKLSGEYQLTLYERVQRFLVDRVIWCIQTLPLHRPVGEIAEHYISQVNRLDSFIEHVDNYTKTQSDQFSTDLLAHNVPQRLADRLASLPVLAAIAPVTYISQATGTDAVIVASVYYRIDALFHLTRLTDSISQLRFDDSYDRRAVYEALMSIQQAHKNMITGIVRRKQGMNVAFQSWKVEYQNQIEQTLAILESISRESTLSIARIMLTASQLSRLGSATLDSVVT